MISIGTRPSKKESCTLLTTCHLSLKPCLGFAANLPDLHLEKRPCTLPLGLQVLGKDFRCFQSLGCGSLGGGECTGGTWIPGLVQGLIWGPCSASAEGGPALGGAGILGGPHPLFAVRRQMSCIGRGPENIDTEGVSLRVGGPRPASLIQGDLS